MVKRFFKLWRDDAGQDLTEYVMLVVIIALGVTLAVVALRDELISVFFQAGAGPN